MKTAEALAAGFEFKMPFFSPEIRAEKVLEFVRYVQRDAQRDLLAALIEMVAMVRRLCGSDGNTETMGRAEAAIAKAEGNS